MKTLGNVNKLNHKVFLQVYQLITCENSKKCQQVEPQGSLQVYQLIICSLHAYDVHWISHQLDIIYYLIQNFFILYHKKG